MFAFVAYAIGVWYAAARYRRRLAAFLWVGAGLLGLLGIAYLHHWLSVWTGGKIYVPLMRSLLYPYTLLVVAVGVFIACLPRPPSPCRKCGHDTSQDGLDARACGGCGLPRAYRAQGTRCGLCKYDLSGLDLDEGRCPECGTFYFDRGRKRTRFDPIRGPQPPEELVAKPVVEPEVAGVTGEARSEARRRILSRMVHRPEEPTAVESDR